MEKAYETASQVASSVAASIDPYVPQAVKDNASSAATYAQETMTSLSEKAAGVKDYAMQNAASAVNYAKGTFTWAMNGATTTITAYTPGPVLTFMNQTLESAKAVKEDPAAVLKTYVPAFVIHTSERTYEIVTDIPQQTKDTVSATTGYIVSKVNGTVEYVSSIPQVHTVIEKLNTLAAPVLSKISSGSAVDNVDAEMAVAAAAE